MQEYLKTRKSKPSFEMNWKIRELFSETALANFSSDIDLKRLELEKNKNK